MAGESLSRDDRVFMAKLAEQAERYEDMVQHMKEVASNYQDLNSEERNLFSVAYKNVVGRHRASWRQLSTVKTKEREKSNGVPDEVIDNYVLKVAMDLKAVCEDVLQFLDEYLITKDDIPAEEQNESLIEAAVFFKKMKGDYLRYMAEFHEGNERKDYGNRAKEAYKKATDLAKKHLKATNPILLGLALNCSVFYYEIQESPEQACAMAKTAFDEAIAHLDTLPEDSYKDSTLIMQLLRDNLTLWTTDMQEENEGNAGDTQVQDIEGEES